MRKLPLFSFLCSSGGCQNLRVASLDTGECHRLSRIATGTGVWPSAQNGVYRQRKYCRSASYTAGRQSIPAESANDSNRGQGKAWQHNSRHICTNHVPYHDNDSKGHVPQFSDHQSRISMHDGPKNQVDAHHLQNQTNGSTVVPMSVLWLVPQLVIAGIAEAFHLPGNVAFYYQEFPPLLKSTSTALVALLIGIAFYLSTAVVGIVRRATLWLPDNINDGRMDNVYWVLSSVGVLNFGYYLVCAWLYKYQDVEDVVDDDDDGFRSIE